MKFIVATLFLVAGLSQAASAESFNLTAAEHIYGCNSQETLDRLIDAAAHENYAAALLLVASIENQACPLSGPFVGDMLHARVVYEEEGGLVRDFRSIVIVEWSWANSTREYYSVLVQNQFGIWQDMVDTIIEMRTANGILEFFSQ